MILIDTNVYIFLHSFPIVTEASVQTLRKIHDPLVIEVSRQTI